MGAHDPAAPRRRPRRRRRPVVWTLIAVLALALVAAGALVAVRQLDTSDELPPGIPARPAAITADPQIRPVAADAPQPTPAGVSRQIAQSLRDPALGQFTGQISDSVTGTVLWSRGADRPRTPASNAKILTAAAALVELPHDKRITTSVFAGPGGQVILKGAGDPTLSAQPRGSDTFYTDPGRIADLAAQIKDAGVPVTSVAIDLSAYSGPTMAKTWDRRDIAGGDITPIESLIADGGRIRPLDEFSPRVDDPGITAGQALARALGVSTTVTEVNAPAGAREVASVRSAPLVTRVNDMLRFSDNVLAETLSIELATAKGRPATLADGVNAIEQSMSANFADAAGGTTLSDASGLSYANKVPAAMLDTLMAAASGSAGAAGTGTGTGTDDSSDSDDSGDSDGTVQAKMRPMLDGLPVAGGTGTLADRFDVRTNPGAGWVRAKTGTLTGVSSLTGIVQTVDGRVLSFALISGGTSPADARPALDAIPGDLRECGCR
ncbi:D-alanyl-D-alanine carboxypeptidase/D-alanyl-D-alanine-endopeptidase [Gordonia sinesedis]